ncbi:hypothetical protein LCM02_08235 [Lutimonas saemankumensis]|uniref:DUF6090 family protein n=1 Tax=Lutimonas saemankumensis TaxID=483016 RepID=UPI001CD4B1FE|nr:DUF6090 family protein [Lutimonas saemankumensis]MCA0932436.1 hypothetical protein [Lutimonas saemankumensis]
MLPFFRKIRWRLAQDNQFFKYSRYAIGEIVLVVIGILIALQINNWNEQRKERELEKRLLFNLKQEFEENLNTINSVISKRQIQLNGLRRFDSLIMDPRFLVKYSEIDSLIGLSRYIPNFEPKTGVLENIISSGQLSIIQNGSLRKSLSNWTGELDDLRRKEDALQDIIVFQLNPYLTKKHTLLLSDNYIVETLWDNNTYFDKAWRINRNSSVAELKYDRLLKDPEFESLLSLINLWAISGQLSSEILKEKVERVIAIIDQNLDD